MPAFYAENHSAVLRFGDVVVGFPVVIPATHEKDSAARTATWSIAVTRPAHLVVMTPCCSIEDKRIILAPLLPLRPAFFRNPFFAEDPTRINGKVPAEKSVPPEVWSHLLPEEQTKRLALGVLYVFDECFVYPPHALLDSYKLDRPGGAQQVGHYMLDFKTIYPVECKLVNRGAAPPAGMKLLQLSIPARQALREKTSLFFGRVAEEDTVAV